MREIKGNLIRGHLETMILSVLEEAESHGLEILRRLEERGCGALHLKEGSLYPALYRLEDAGLVRAAWEEPVRGRRGARRRFYRLTRKGDRALDARREEWQHFVQVVGGIVGVSS